MCRNCFKKIIKYHYRKWYFDSLFFLLYSIIQTPINLIWYISLTVKKTIINVTIVCEDCRLCMYVIYHYIWIHQRVKTPYIKRDCIWKKIWGKKLDYFAFNFKLEHDPPARGGFDFYIFFIILMTFLKI